MRTSRGELDIRKEFGFYDLGFTAAVGANNVAVYEHLRRFVWRKGKEYEEGSLVARVSQAKLATLTGLARETICRSIEKLVSIGWVDSRGVREGKIYVLGEVVRDKENKGYEVFYADAICASVAEKIGDIGERTSEEVVGEVQQELGVIRGIPKTEDLVILDHNLVISDHNPCDLRSQPSDLRSHIIDKNITSAEVAKPIHPSGEPQIGYALSDPERSEGEVLLSTPPEKVDQTPAAATRRVEEVSNGVPIPVEDKSVQDRMQVIADHKEKGKALSQAARQKRMDKESVRDQKIRNLGGKGAFDDPEYRVLLGQLEKVWRRLFKGNFPNAPIARWEGCEFGQVKQLIAKYKGGYVEAGFAYITTNWEKIQTRFKKSSKYPTPGFLLNLHDTLIPEAVVWNRVASVKEEWDSWWKEHPNEFDPPEDLKRRYDECRKDLETLGIV